MSIESNPWKITLSDIDLGSPEREAVEAVLLSKWLTMGQRTAEFEQRFASAVGARHAVAVSNGTAALHLALEAVGVGPGDEVIVPSLTFVATANAVRYLGATPVFADVQSEETLLMDPEDVGRKITSKTKAVIPVHYGGYPCDMDAFSAMGAEHGFAVVDDAAHAPGSRYKGRPIGSAADLSCFSFFANKNLVCGEGGMVTTQDEELAKRIRTNRSHGMTAVSLDKHRGHAFTYDVVSLGYNYRINEIQSALGLVQLSKLEENNAKRRSRVGTYRDRLGAVSDLILPFAGRDDESACHLFVVVLPEGSRRDDIQSHMKVNGIQTSVHYPPVHRFSSFRDHRGNDLSTVESIADRLLTLPLHPLMSDDDVHTVCDALEAARR